MRLHHRLAVIALGAALLLLGGTAAAGTRSFSAGSLIIPMDLCYQPTDGTGGWSSGSLPSGLPSSYCPDPVSSTSNGVTRAYGLVYTFLQNSIPVYYIIEPTKTTLAGVDLTVTNPAGTPVSRLKHSDGTTVEFMTSTNTSVALRGAPFVIDVANAAAATAIIVADRNGPNMFGNVKVLYSKVNFNAPVKATLTGPPPLIALNGLDPTNVTILQNYLADAGLSTANISYWPTVGPAFTVVGYDGAYTDFTTSDALNVGKFAVVWSPHWEGVKSIMIGANSGITTSGPAQIALNDVLHKMALFSDAGNSTFAECIGMGTIEGSIDPFSGAPAQGGNTYGHFLTNSTGATQGLTTNVIGGGWPQGNAGELISTPTSEATNPIVQIGDYVYSSVNGYIEDYVPNTGVSYVANIHRLMTTVAPAGEAADNGRDLVVTGNKDGDPTKGPVVYLAGHRYDSSGGSTLPAGLRIPLNTLLFLGQINITVEVSRSAPIVYSDGKTYLGSYVQQTMPSTAYPPWQGHFREYSPGALSGANVASFGSLTANWDAATHVTAQAAADSRTIFTAVPVAGKLTKVAFTTGNLATLQTVVPSLTAATITAVRKGGLGGIDHSIPAIIGPSQVAGVSTRPVVGYFGALDGMLHAILISGTVTGKSPGDELWAFIPPSQLAATVGQAGGVDGSPSVGDAFVDTTGGGTRSWHTVLGISDGIYTGGTLDAIDITDPTVSGGPPFLWEASDSITVSGKTYNMGRAQGAAMSLSSVGGGTPNYTFFIATDNAGGSWGNGFNMYAVDAGNGSIVWRFNHTYPSDTSHNDVPGIAAVIDAAGDGGPATKVYFGDIEGKVWAMDAATGANATAIYDAAVANGNSGSINYPIESGVVLYRDPTNSHLDILGVTGGADWVPSTTLSSVFKVDTTNNTGTNLLTLGVGERVYAVPTIYGNSAYLITATGNLQGVTGTDFSTTGGNLLRINLGSAGGSTTLATVKAGASEVAVDASGNVVAASTSGLTKNANAGQDKSQAVVSLQNVAAKLLTVRAWLDLH